MMPSEPIIEDEMVVTLWPYVAHQKTDYEDDDGLNASAQALQRVHDVLADYPMRFPRMQKR
jgi:predicted AAA+ superfamily ATPase